MQICALTSLLTARKGREEEEGKGTQMDLQLVTSALLEKGKKKGRDR